MHLKSRQENIEVTDQTSIIRFVEDNWGVGLIGDYSLDERAGALDNMFDFSGRKQAQPLFLDPATGQVIQDQE